MQEAHEGAYQSRTIEKKSNGMLMMTDEPREAVHAVAVEHWIHAAVVVIVLELCISILTDPLSMCNCQKNCIVFACRVMLPFGAHTYTTVLK